MRWECVISTSLSFLHFPWQEATARAMIDVLEEPDSHVNASTSAESHWLGPSLPIAAGFWSSALMMTPSILCLAMCASVALSVVISVTIMYVWFLLWLQTFGE